MKKFLSMVLALVMVMSLMTFAPAAGAKNFTDNDSITYKEAVAVITEVGIMDGRTPETFVPQETLTRQAAAKIICNMILGPTTASALPSTAAPFPDVPQGHQFAGYIAYCAEHNIISGYADGNFRPGDSLSGYAFLKMLLCALGYDQEIEKYQGANWRVNVAKQALGISLDNGLLTELDGSRIVTREEAALYAFNTLQADMVEYDTKTTVSVSGATVTVGGNSFRSKTTSSQNAKRDNIDQAQNQNLDIIQFGEEYFPNLRRNPANHSNAVGDPGDFGEPKVTWTWKGTEIGKYDNATVSKDYTSNVKITDIYSALNLNGTPEKKAKVYVNGYLAFTIPIERSNGDKLFADGDQKEYDTTDNNVDYDYVAAGKAARYTEICNAVGDGSLIKVFYDEDEGQVTICVMSVYPGQINTVKAATSSRNAYVVVTYKGADGVVNGVVNQDYVINGFKDNKYNEYETDEAFEEDDMVWFTFSQKAKSIGEVHKMTSVEGKLDSRKAEDSVKLDGTSYSYGKYIGFDASALGEDEDSLNNDSSYVLYLDNAGYVLYVEEAEFESENYALIKRISVEASNGGDVYNSVLTGGKPTLSTSNEWNTNVARLVMSDGVERTVDLTNVKNYRDETGTGRIKNGFMAGCVVRYAEQSDGTYKLYSLGNESQARSNYPGDGGAVYSINSKHQETGNVYAYNAFTAANMNQVGTYTNGNTANVKWAISGSAAESDGETIFVVKDGGSYIVKTGLRNAPQIVDDRAIAYAYISGNVANGFKTKIVFVVNGDTTNSSKDIVFLAGASRSKPIDKSDLQDTYYEYNALVNGSVETVRIYDNAKTGDLVAYRNDNQTLANKAYAIKVDTSAKAVNSIILNDCRYDGDDVMESGSFHSLTLTPGRQVGVKKVSNSTTEIKLGTGVAYGGADTIEAIPANNKVEYLAGSCNIYLVDSDGEIAEITYSEIKNDDEAIVFYTMNDDAEITNLFICET